MSITLLRNLITVTDWQLTKLGVAISYTRRDNPGKPFHLTHEPLESLRNLDALTSIDGFIDNPLKVIYSGGECSWDYFVKTYKLSQWDALNIVIRHELMAESENELMSLTNTFKLS